LDMILDDPPLASFIDSWGRGGVQARVAGF
jgi:hypothetical protein